MASYTRCKESTMILIFNMKKYYKIYASVGIIMTPKRKKMQWSTPIVYERVRLLNIWTPFMKKLKIKKVTEYHKRVKLL